MISPDKLSRIQPGQRRRKLALCFGALERDIAGIAESGCEYSFSSMTREEYTKTLIRIVLQDPGLSVQGRRDIEEKLYADPFDTLRACNCARHHLLETIGSFPAEWDLIIAPHHNCAKPVQRSFFPGVMAYAEDIRSPFNLGSIFRTAEALGAEKLLLSPCCTAPEHPRAQRSAMGCIETLPWQRMLLDEIPFKIPVFVLETGGIPLNEFTFPQQGIVIIGSEELGVSPEALKRCSAGRVSIPMRGLKASLNVGVAFGILMQAWANFLEEK